MSTTPTAPAPSWTPNRRGEPTSARRSVHTPLNRNGPREVLNSVRRGIDPTSATKKNNAATPHTKAARRALNQRRTNMFTPGKNRRRSQMQERETPMGILRNLSRALAPASQPIPSSSSSPRGKSDITGIQEEEEDEDDDLYNDEDELPIDRPRFSLPIDEDDGGSDEDLRPPRLSQVEDENYTVQSVELPRRFSQAPSRLSRGSFGSEGASNMFNPDVTEDVGQQSDFFPGFLDDLQAGPVDDDPSLERLDPDQSRRITMGHESFNLDMPDGIGEETDFLLEDMPPPEEETGPIVSQFVAAAMGQQPQEEPAVDVASRGPDSDAGGADFDDGLDFDAGGFDDHSSIIEEEHVVPEAELGFKPDAESVRPKSKMPSRVRAKQKRISKHGTEYPALPPSFVKRVAQTALQSSGLSNQRITPDTLDALSQASEWFFEQLGDDLGAYADHAKRKTIEESDVFTLMKRQRQVGSHSTVFSLAQKHLPRELLQELRMPAPLPPKQRRAKLRREDTADDVTENT